MSHTLSIEHAGAPLQADNKVLIMLHGRGSTSSDILSLAKHFDIDGYTLLAPQATNHSWYPYSFMAAKQDNEPWLSSALNMVEETVKTALDAGVPTENIYFFGFSQGACLTLEFLGRHAKHYGGAIAIIGGLIGEQIDHTAYAGNFEQTPMLLATSDPDAHVPLTRVKESVAILAAMQADITLRVYESFGHSINQEQIDLANRIIFNKS